MFGFEKASYGSSVMTQVSIFFLAWSTRDWKANADRLRQRYPQLMVVSCKSLVDGYRRIAKAGADLCYIIHENQEPLFDLSALPLYTEGRATIYGNNSHDVFAGIKLLRPKDLARWITPKTKRVHEIFDGTGWTYAEELKSRTVQPEAEVFLISYDEENAEENYDHLRNICPRALRVRMDPCLPGHG